MILKKWYLMSFLALFLSFSAGAHSPTNLNPVANGGGINNNASTTTEASFRNDCRKPEAQRDQDVNNVRARLTTGGDVWWDRSDGKYVVPKPLNEGDTEVSAIFAGGVWLGGLQDGNFRVAAQQYGNGGGNTRDFWTGPLDDITGLTNDTLCTQWDRFWVVTREEIELHLLNYNQSLEGGDYDASAIPAGVKGWPGQGNQFFFEINGFDLPVTSAGLGSFYDQNGNEIYEPLLGDYPVIEIEGCDIAEAPQYADQMYFWIYNDNGNIHTESNGDAIRMEIQVQSFAYATNDALNNMTFQRYKLINRAPARIDSTHFGMWVDADLGCFTDDYIGCDVSRSLGYYYNVDAEDGDVGVNCPGGVGTYGTEIPALGVDYFRGPKRPLFNADTTEVIGFEELGMSSFTYFNNPGEGNPPNPETDPNTVQEYFNYLTGSWRDGSPFTEGGNGYGGTTPVNYVFPDAPDDPTGWSMCTSSEFNSPEYDRRTLQASGPFLLLPGEVNELIIGAVWMPDFAYPCPDLSRLFTADDLAQSLFDSCFDILDGPDAPDVDIIELDNELVLILTNDELTSNNAFELYEERDIQAPVGGDTTYNFQGYLVYQLAGPTVTANDFDNPAKARLIYQVDKKDGIGEITNWAALEGIPDNIPDAIFVPSPEVQGQDAGINHTFVVDSDQFASGGNNRLINHKKYYFSTIAYAHNNWGDFDPTLGEGQRSAYIEGRRNIKTYTALPRPITDQNLNANYGDGTQVTRWDGVGVGSNFVQLTDETRAEITSSASFNTGARFNGPLVYEQGAGPIDVKIYNPLDVKDGQFKLEILDANFGEGADLATWKLTDENSNVQIESEKSIDQLNEQIIGEYGFSVSIGQAAEPGQQADVSNGAIGSLETYVDADPTPWYAGIPNRGGEFLAGNFLSQFLAWISEPDVANFDPNRRLIDTGSGFVPYQLANYRQSDFGALGYLSPAWIGAQAGFVRSLPDNLAKLNNVDIVFTSDKNLWSQCVIVETANSFTQGIGIPTVGGASHMDVRQSPSVSKEAGADGLPTVDNSAPNALGMGWFPGYAIDVETGQRLNIFFGENSIYDCENFGGCDVFNGQEATGADMMYNPGSQAFLEIGDFPSAFNMYLGGQHFIYVTDQPYDKCQEIYEGLDGDAFGKVEALQNVTWTGVTMSNGNTSMRSYADGLIPSDLVVKLRADNAYANAEGTTDEAGENPAYTFSINDKQATERDAAGIDSQLDAIGVVPNPYYGISDYEGSPTDNIVKITNLPAKCVVTIYSLDGKFIRQYNRDETGGAPVGSGITKNQVNPDVEWNLKNSKNIPIAGGVYLIHVDAEGLGERVIKWFGTNRAFDPSQL